MRPLPLLDGVGEVRFGDEVILFGLTREDLISVKKWLHGRVKIHYMWS